MKILVTILFIVIATAVVAAIDAFRKAPEMDIDDDGFLENRKNENL